MFSGNELTSLPESFCCLTTLTELNLECVSSSFLLSCWRVACRTWRVHVVVVFSRNKLTSLPDLFGNLTHLVTLDLKYVLPCHAFHTLRVRAVFSRNTLTSLPDSFCNLTQLASLNLRYVSLFSSRAYQVPPLLFWYRLRRCCVPT